MKMQFLFKILEINTGKVYFGIHSSDDLSFASPVVNLSAVASREQLFEHLPHYMQQYIRSLGKHAFIVTALDCGDRASLRQRMKFLKSLTSPHVLLNHQYVNDQRHVWAEKHRQSMKGNQNGRDGRKKYSKYRKKKCKNCMKIAPRKCYLHIGLTNVRE